MKKLFTAIFAIGGLSVGILALAAVLTFGWQNATTNTDGSAIPASGPGSVTTHIEYGTCNAAKTAIVTVLGSIDAATGASTAPTPNLAPGIYCGRAWHINTFGIASDPTGVVSAEILAPKPNKPANFTFG